MVTNRLAWMPRFLQSMVEDVLFINLLQHIPLLHATFRSNIQSFLYRDSDLGECVFLSTS